MGGADRQARGVCGRAERLNRSGPPAWKAVGASPARHRPAIRSGGSAALAAPATSKTGMLSAHPGLFLFLSYPAAAQCRRTSLSGEGPGAGSLRPRAALLGSLTPGPLPNRRKKPAAPLACGFLVPVTGIEPVRCFHRQILSLLRLPISPHRQILAHLVYHSPQENAREAQRNQAALGNMIQLWGAAPSRPRAACGGLY